MSEADIAGAVPTGDEEVPLGEALAAVEWWRWLLIVGLVMLSGCFSGLNLGVLGLDTKDLEMMTEGPYETVEDEKIGKLAAKLLPLRRRGNLLLCAILLGNVMVNSLLSILMSDIAGGLIALLSSTALIVVFGEILPQAICSRHGVKAGAYLAWLLWITIFVTFIFAFPISAILDKVLGEEVGAVMTKSKMKKLFDIQEKEMNIEAQENRIMQATLSLSERPISEVMFDIDEVYMLEINTLINREVTQEIYTKGFSRIPIYDRERQNICGVLMAKDLILFNPDRDQMTIKQLSSVLRDIVYIDHTTSCLRVLTQFKEGSTHMAIVTKVETAEPTDPYLSKIGLITLEDIIEEVIGDEIEDEYEGDGKEERQNQKKQLLTLFMKRQAGNILQENELKAVREFLSSYVAPFYENRLRSAVLNKLVSEAEVLNIDPDSKRFNPSIEIVAIKEASAEEEVVNTERILLEPKSQADQDTDNQLIKISEKERVLTNEIVATVDNSDQIFNPVLYTRGVDSDAFNLILSGKVSVCSGNEGFMLTHSSFNYLGAEALVRDDYRPDFSAKVVDQARILRITRTQYRKALSDISQTKQVVRNRQ